MASNKYMVGLRDMIEQRYAPADKKLKNSEWLMKNTTLRGKPFSFDRYPFQIALVDDENRNSVTLKPSQVGVSEIYQRLALALMRRNPHRKMIYAYPDDMMRQKNVQTRVHPIADQPAFFQDGEAKPIRSIDLVQIGSSWLYMTGSKVGDATSTDADAVFLDEYDLHDMAIAALFRSRMQNSDWKLDRKFSTPTWAGYGVSGEYDDSDQTSYMIRCDACNHWQFPMFTPAFIEIPGLPIDYTDDLTTLDQAAVEHLDLDLRGSYVCCSKCRAKLDLSRTDNRQWVTKYPSRTHMKKGWKVNPFSTSTRPPVDLFSDLWTYQKNNNIKGFRNSSLGEPEDTGSNRLQEADIRACLGQRAVPPIEQKPTWIGIDMGHQCHILVGQGHSIKELKVVRAIKTPIKELASVVSALLATYYVVGGACDRHPESLAAEQLRVLSGGRIIPCEYRGQKQVNLVKDPITEEVTHAQINRTQIIDGAAEQIRKKWIHFNGFEDQAEEIVAHYRNMIREENPEKEAVWKKLDNNDHYFHAGAFLNAAILVKDYEENIDGPVATVIGIAGVDMRGYNTALIGSKPKPNSPWQPLTFSRS